MKQRKQIIIKDAFYALLISSLIILTVSLIHLISNHFGITKKVMLSAIYISYLTHILLYFLQIPILQILLSFSTEIFLHRLLSTFPVINTKSFNFYYPLVVFSITQVLLIFYTVRSNLGVPEIILCFLVTSLAPLTIFYYIGGGVSSFLKW